MVPFPKIAFSEFKIKIFRISQKKIVHFILYPLPWEDFTYSLYQVMNKTKIEKTRIALRDLEQLGIQSARGETEERERTGRR
jgi:hypothetical protein